MQSEALVDSMAKLELGSEISESKNNQEEPVENAEQEDEEERQALAHVVGILEAVPETRLNVPGFLRPFEQESMKFFVQVCLHYSIYCFVCQVLLIAVRSFRSQRPTWPTSVPSMAGEDPKR